MILCKTLYKYRTRQETFTVPRPEALLITKQKAYFDRKTSIKGQKDKIDIISLLLLRDFDFDFLKKILSQYNLTNYINELHNILSETKEVKELALNPHHFAKWKKQVLPRLSLN